MADVIHTTVSLATALLFGALIGFERQ